VPPLALWNVDDASAFCWAIVRKTGLELDFHDAEDLHQYLFTECWRLSLRYQPGGPDFDGWASRILRVRVVDWTRQRNGRTKWAFSDHAYERPRRQLVSYDSERDRLDAALGTWTSDPAAGRDSDLGRLVSTGDRQRARDLQILGLRAPHRAC
jgi:DNA-directed RNA polymerase specialized sigma24 family protein